MKMQSRAKRKTLIILDPGPYTTFFNSCHKVAASLLAQEIRNENREPRITNQITNQQSNQVLTLNNKNHPAHPRPQPNKIQNTFPGFSWSKTVRPALRCNPKHAPLPPN